MDLIVARVSLGILDLQSEKYELLADSIIAGPGVYLLPIMECLSLDNCRTIVKFFVQ